jgi:hypothetical protein
MAGKKSAFFSDSFSRDREDTGRRDRLGAGFRQNGRADYDHDDEDEEDDDQEGSQQSDERSDRGGGRAASAARRLHDEDDDPDEDSDLDDRPEGDDDDDDDDEHTSKKKSKKEAARDRRTAGRMASVQQVALTWGPEVIKVVMSHFKRVSYKFRMNNEEYWMDAFFAHTRSDAHLVEINATFMVPYTTTTTSTKLDFLFTSAESRVSDIMSKYIADHAHKHSSIGQMYGCIKSNRVIIKSISVLNVVSTQPTPLSINIDGIGGKYTNPHYSSWAPKTPCLAVITPCPMKQKIFDLNMRDSPDLPAFHGIHPITNSTDETLWGERIGDTILVSTPSSRFKWLMINLPYLISDYIVREVQNKATGKMEAPKRGLPDGVSSETWKKIKKFAEKHPLQNIYDADAKLTDNYIGKLMKILLPTRKEELLWTMCQDKLAYRVPLDFLQFAIPRHVETTQPVRPVDPTEIVMKTSAPPKGAGGGLGAPPHPPSGGHVKPSEPAQASSLIDFQSLDGGAPGKYAPGDMITFTIRAQVFPPQMFYMVTKRKKKEDEDK